MQRLPLWSIVLVIALAGCAGEAAPATTSTPSSTTPTTVNVDTLQRFESPELGFAISYPDQWAIAPSLEEGIVEFSAPVGQGGFTPNFNVSTGTVPGDVPPFVYYDGEKSKLESNLPDVQVLEEANVDVDGVIGRGITILTVQAGVDVGISRLLVLKDGQAWEVSFFAEAGQMEQMAPLITAVFHSFEFMP